MGGSTSDHQHYNPISYQVKRIEDEPYKFTLINLEDEDKTVVVELQIYSESSENYPE